MKKGDSHGGAAEQREVSHGGTEARRSFNLKRAAEISTLVGFWHGSVFGTADDADFADFFERCNIFQTMSEKSG
ncbi:MAG: hypothetical protein KBI41_10440 [Kiritimatiellae bacterium]|nr:hypothetical protein [Kiritimatiellia bacterium]